MMRFSLLLILILTFACSDDSTSPHNTSGISGGLLNGLYRGSLNVQFTGGYEDSWQSSNILATASKDQKDNYLLTFQDQNLGIAFIGYTNGLNPTISFVNEFADEAGEMIGTFNNDPILLLSDSGTFTITELTQGKFTGKFTGQFNGFLNNTQPVISSVQATFSFSQTTQVLP